MDIFGNNLQSIKDNVKRARNLVWYDPSETFFWTSGTTILGKSKDDGISAIKSESLEIESLAIEPYTKTLFYSIPQLQRITRIAMDGELVTILPIVAMARNLVIDSELAKLCWINLQNTIECSDLFGTRRVEIERFGIWEDKKVVNMALDELHHIIYFTIYSPLSSERYTFYARKINDDADKSKLGSLSSQRIHGNMVYIDRKLFFIQNSNELVTYDIDGKSMATIPCKSKIFDIQLAVQEKRNLSAIQVIPEKIQEDSVKFIGTLTNLTLVWGQISNINIGKVTYKARLSAPDWTKEWVLSENYIKISGEIKLSPFTKVNVTLNSFSSWSMSPSTTLYLSTPESTPGQPTNLRAYWTAFNESLTKYTVRWDSPLEINGVLLYYKLSCKQNEQDVCFDVVTNKTVIDIFLPQDVYTLRVAGVTKTGQGDWSDKFETLNLTNNPIPMIAMGVSYPPAVMLVDIDCKTSVTHQLQTRAEHLAYLTLINELILIEKHGLVNALDLKTLKGPYHVPKTFDML